MPILTENHYNFMNFSVICQSLFSAIHRLTSKTCQMRPVGIDHAQRGDRSAARQHASDSPCGECIRAECRDVEDAVPYGNRGQSAPQGRAIRRPAARFEFALRRMHSCRMPGRRGRRPLRQQRAVRTAGTSDPSPAPRRDRSCPKGRAIRRPAARFGFALRRMHSCRMPGRRGRRPLRRKRAVCTVGASSARPRARFSPAAPRSVAKPPSSHSERGKEYDCGIQRDKTDSSLRSE